MYMYEFIMCMYACSCVCVYVCVCVCVCVCIGFLKYGHIYSMYNYHLCGYIATYMHACMKALGQKIFAVFV